MAYISKYPTIKDFINLPQQGLSMDDVLRQPIFKQWILPKPCPACGFTVDYFTAAGLSITATTMRDYKGMKKPLAQCCPGCGVALTFTHVDVKNRPLDWAWAVTGAFRPAR